MSIKPLISIKNLVPIPFVLSFILLSHGIGENGKWNENLSYLAINNVNNNNKNNNNNDNNNCANYTWSIAHDI